MRFFTVAALVAAIPPALAAQSAPAVAFQARGAFFAVSVPDMAAARAWYEQKLGLRVLSAPPPHEGVSALILEGGGLIVELIHSPRSQPAPAGNAIERQGLFKVGVVVDDFDATLRSLRERGIPLAFGPFPAGNGQRANFAIRDTSGTMIQFFGP